MTRDHLCSPHPNYSNSLTLSRSACPAPPFLLKFHPRLRPEPSPHSCFWPPDHPTAFPCGRSMCLLSAGPVSITNHVILAPHPPLPPQSEHLTDHLIKEHEKCFFTKANFSARFPPKTSSFTVLLVSVDSLLSCQLHDDFANFISNTVFISLSCILCGAHL